MKNKVKKRLALTATLVLCLLAGMSVFTFGAVGSGWGTYSDTPYGGSTNLAWDSGMFYVNVYTGTESNKTLYSSRAVTVKATNHNSSANGSHDLFREMIMQQTNYTFSSGANTAGFRIGSSDTQKYASQQVGDNYIAIYPYFSVTIPAGHHYEKYEVGSKENAGVYLWPVTSASNQSNFLAGKSAGASASTLSGCLRVGTCASGLSTVSRSYSTDGKFHRVYASLNILMSPNTYTVSYNGNGHTSGSTANSSHTYGTAKVLTANGFKRTGYTFKGWATTEARADAGTVDYTDKKSVKNLTATHKGTVNLYAVWQANTYTVVYNGNGHTSGSTASSSHTYGTAKALTANGFKKEGYTFKGWASTKAKADAGTVEYTDKKSVSNLTSTNGGTVNLYAVWQPYTYTLKMHPLGGTINGADSFAVTQGKSRGSAFSIAEREGYRFRGWYTKPQGGDQMIDEAGVPTSNGGYFSSNSVSAVWEKVMNNGETLDLYARWIPDVEGAYVSVLNETHEVPNIPTLKIRKTDEKTNKPLQGATFELTDGASYIEQRTTGEDGSAVWENIPDGTYTLTEVSPPPSYKEQSVIDNMHPQKVIVAGGKVSVFAVTEE